eukprot:3199363-Prymnesium_polylepis.1
MRCVYGIAIVAPAHPPSCRSHRADPIVHATALVGRSTPRAPDPCTSGPTHGAHTFAHAYGHAYAPATPRRPDLALSAWTPH